YPHVLYSWLVIIFFILVGWLAGKNVQLIPNKAQNLFEIVIEGLEDFQVEMMGEEGRKFFPLIATIGFYVFACNLLGLVPGLFSPTANINTTLACALVTFFATHYVGIKYHGFKYIKHFMGSFLPLAPLMVPIEIIGHLSRVLSLTLRLFGNIMGEDLVLAILLLLAGKFFAPLPMMFLAIFTSFVQAFIFALLSMLYIAGSLEEAH
ncbi:MAG: F0F1 ATP synthase subunit A, partial [Thermodesulfobacteriota bacterium]|nr:F0F1 ATP synthase subunit A [Thermodesulfobacteriota bacterium]